MDSTSVRSLLKEVSETVMLLVMTGLTLGGYLAIAFLFVGVAK